MLEKGIPGRGNCFALALSLFGQWGVHRLVLTIGQGYIDCVGKRACSARETSFIHARRFGSPAPKPMAMKFR